MGLIILFSIAFSAAFCVGVIGWVYFQKAAKGLLAGFATFIFVFFVWPIHEITGVFSFISKPQPPANAQWESIFKTPRPKSIQLIATYQVQGGVTQKYQGVTFWLRSPPKVLHSFFLDRGFLPLSESTIKKRRLQHTWYYRNRHQNRSTCKNAQEYEIFEEPAPTGQNLIDNISTKWILFCPLTGETIVGMPPAQ